MLEVKTIEDAMALEGKTFGSGKNARVVSRIENVRVIYGSQIAAAIYWKRPGGATRKVSKHLAYFMEWANKAERDAKRDAKRTPIDTILCNLNSAVDDVLADVPTGTQIKGFIHREGDEVTISFKLV